jgi:hypothetical protein
MKNFKTILKVKEAIFKMNLLNIRNLENFIKMLLNL